MVFHVLSNQLTELERLWELYSEAYRLGIYDEQASLAKRMVEIQTAMSTVIQGYNFQSLVDTTGEKYSVTQRS